VKATIKPVAVRADSDASSIAAAVGSLFRSTLVVPRLRLDPLRPYRRSPEPTKAASASGYLDFSAASQLCRGSRAGR